ncbi:MAG: stage II sporulation protein M [Candidatus Diapherotrites archaeon]|nr:stage II sporulation protein M [Candidatus Diapherotrites archaeon]
MVLEALETIETIKNNSALTVLVAFVVSTFSIFTSYYMFSEHASVLSLLFITVAMMPLVHTLFSKEEEKEVEKPGFAPGFIIRHFTLIKFYSWFFIGLIISYSLFYVILPNEKPLNCKQTFSLTCIMPPKQAIFKEQIKQFYAISGRATEVNETTIAYDECKNPETRSFEKCRDFIFSNNVYVMGLHVLFSFLYGAGAIELLGWNASVLATFIGKEISENDLSSGIALAIGYLPHGIFEITAYFIGAIAGGIISAAISRRKFRTYEFEIIAKDVLVLILLSYILLYIGAWIESMIIMAQ